MCVSSLVVRQWYVYHLSSFLDFPSSKVHGANMGPTWGRQDPGESHVGHMNLAIIFKIAEISPSIVVRLALVKHIWDFHNTYKCPSFCQFNITSSRL